jgi:thioredoxin reductase
MKRVAVIGAGPIGLAAAAHLVERGFEPVVLEAGPSVAASLESFRHVQLFSPWRYNLDPAARRLLEPTGWKAPQLDFLPTAGAMIDRYLAPLARLPELSSAIHYSHRVLDVAREGFDKVKSKGREDARFVIRVATARGTEEVRAWAVIDASGSWSKPNPLGANGLPAIGEREASAHIAYGMPDVLGPLRSRYAGKRVVVAGAGHSAAGNLLALAKLAEMVPDTKIVWTIRGHNFARIFGGGENDGLAARGALGRRLQALAESGKLEVVPDFRTFAVELGPAPSSACADARGDDASSRAPQHGDGTGSKLTLRGYGPNGEIRTIDNVDEIIVSAGGRPDLSISSELRVKLDPWIESTEQLAPLIDPNVHSCGTVRPHGHRELEHPEKRFYAVGAKSYGRAPNFLLATGHEQVRSVVAALAGDLAAADDVQLDLPQTGVCSTQFDEASSGCCGGPEIVPRTSAAAAASGATSVLAPAATGGCGTTSCEGAATKREDACCGLDEKIKDAGGSGCGSEASKAATARAQEKTAQAKSSSCCR